MATKKKISKKKTPKKAARRKPVLKKKLTLKQERFCQLYIETGNASKSYRQSYDCERMKPETINRTAKDLLDHRKITARLKELQAEHRYRHDITVDSLSSELEEARLLAMKKENPAGAVSAIIGKAKLHGILMKEKSATIRIDKLTGPLTQRGLKIISAMGKGAVSPSDASSMLQALAAQTRILEADELEKRVRKLEGK